MKLLRRVPQLTHPTLVELRIEPAVELESRVGRNRFVHASLGHAEAQLVHGLSQQLPGNQLIQHGGLQPRAVDEAGIESFSELGGNPPLLTLHRQQKLALGDLLAVNAGHLGIGIHKEVERPEAEDGQHEDHDPGQDLEAEALGLITQLLQH